MKVKLGSPRKTSKEKVKERREAKRNVCLRCRFYYRCGHNKRSKCADFKQSG